MAKGKMKVSLDTIKELRQMTSASVSDCKKSLEEAKGDMKLALELLKKRGLEIAAKKASRTASEGKVEAYIHLGAKIGVILEVDCETDFVAKNEEFGQFVKDIAMQIAAVNPRYLRREDVPKEELSSLDDQERFYQEHCLLEQLFIKDQSITIKDYLSSLIAKTGENIVIKRFARFSVKEGAVIAEIK